jgi:BolA protein
VSDTPSEIERRLRERFAPIHFELTDDSAKHAGHPGASSGGGHYSVVIVSAAFEGRTLLEQHRLVNDAVADLFSEKIHALALRTVAPSRWEE